MTTNQNTLKKFVARRHPDYAAKLPHWSFMQSCYEGGRDWFADNIFQYIKEGETEYSDRLERAYRFNHTREVVDLVNKYLFKMDAARKDEDAGDAVLEFWKKATLHGLSITDYMKQVSQLSSTLGRIWIVVDSNMPEGVQTVAEAREVGGRVYSYTVLPQDALDMSYDDEGKLNWILIHEQIRDDEDPINSDGRTIDRYRLWERNQWTLFTVRTNQKGGDSSANSRTPEEIAKIAKGGKVGEVGTIAAKPRAGKNFTIEVDGPHEHSLGEVPVFAADNVISNEPYASPSLIDDVAYLDRAVANYLSNLDVIIQDQTFSQLTMPAQGLVPGDDDHAKLLAMGTKRIFTYDASGGGKPEYISPDVRQAELILKVVNKIINEIYHTVGLAGERTKEDNALGIDNSSGVAKAYDFERVNSLLASKADSLEVTENRLVRLVRLWNGEGEPEENLVSYPDNFDVRGLYDEFEIAARLSLIEAPELMRKEQMNNMIDKLFPKLGKELKQKMLDEIKNSWPPKPVDLVTGATEQAGTDAISSAATNSLANELVK